MSRPACSADPNAARTSSLRRRIACFLYEGVLLFGVLMIAAYLFSSLTQQRHALASRTLLQGYLFLVLGIYFVWFWSHGGQTLAMKTWHIRLVARDGRAISQARAVARYLLCWLWFMPALLVTWASQAQQLWVLIASLVAGVAIYAASCFTNADRQFLHDALCATRLVTTSPTSPSRP